MDEGRTDYEDYWNELEELHRETKNLEDYLEEECTGQFQEGEKEADWLRDVGLDHLTEAFQQGREIIDSELLPCINFLSKQQAEAVKRRVRSLNQTIRNRYRQQRGRHRKPDIRDVFRDVETSSTGTRSRSATPDSLDSVEDVIEIDDEWTDCSRPEHPVNRESLRRTPSAPTQKVQVRSGQELFRRAGHWPVAAVQRVDVASDTEGIELLGYQRIGTIQGPRAIRDRSRSGSDPAVTLSALDLLDLGNSADIQLRCKDSNQNEVSRSHNNLFQTAVESSGPISFETMCQDSELTSFTSDLNDSELVEIETISDADFSHLKPLLWLEISAIFDRHSVEFHKRKPHKRKRKENGNVFGVNLSTLVMRDRRICTDNSTVPLVFRIILNELEARCSQEEGILRIAGQKQKVEMLCNIIEVNFYTKPDEVKHSLQKSTCHELTAVLKKLLRDLPQPLLTTELVNLFYKIHALPTIENQCKMLNLLILLLPVEHSGTLRALMSFLNSVIRNEKDNKMSVHNVAMIMAPSLFPPKYLQQLEKGDLNGHVKIAAVCCRLVEVMLHCGLDLWRIPQQLWQQLQQKIQNAALRKLKSANGKHITRKKKELLRRSNTHYDSSSRMYSGFSTVHLS